MDHALFLATLTDELLSDEEYLDVSGVGERLRSLSPAISVLQKARTKNDLDDFFSLEASNELATLLLGSPVASAFEAGQASRALASHLLHWRRWAHGEALKSIVVGLLISDAQKTRGRRRRALFGETVAEKLLLSIHQSEIPLALESQYSLRTGFYSRKFDYVILQGDTPTIAVVPILQTTSGGRQQDIFLGLPEIQGALLEVGITLLVIADGPGFRQMEGVVEKVAPQLRFLANLATLDANFLSSVIRHAIEQRDVSLATPTTSYERLAASSEQALRSGVPVTPSILDLTEERSAAFILQFIARHPETALKYEGGAYLGAERENAIRDLRQLLVSARSGADPDLTPILRYISESTGYPLQPMRSEPSLPRFGIHVTGTQLRLPQPLPIFLARHGTYPNREEMLSNIDRSLSQGPTTARTAVILDPFTTPETRSVSLRFSKESRSQLAVLGEEDLIEILLRKPDAARRYFIHAITRDIDLSIVSPFISEGPTPATMFFGRDSEIRRIVEQATRQSFAIIGGRKTGKTSLLQRLRDSIPPKAPVSYIDCQAHPNREDFLAHILSLLPSPDERHTDEILPRAETVLRAYTGSAFAGKPGVFLLDEVDELFLEDSRAERYPHVLSRALRALSQSGDATTVATGERSLFGLTTDPASPHWNFCTPLKIGPLSQVAARHLIYDPLQELGVEVAPAAVDLAAERTALHPNLIQYLGTRLVETLSKADKSSGGSTRIDADLMDLITTSPDFHQRFVVTFFSQATPLEKLIAVNLTSTQARTIEEIRTTLQSAGVDPAAADITRSLAFLDLYFISSQSAAGYQFASPAFDFYLSPLGSSLLLEQWRAELA